MSEDKFEMTGSLSVEIGFSEVKYEIDQRKDGTPMITLRQYDDSVVMDASVFEEMVQRYNTFKQIKEIIKDNH